MILRLLNQDICPGWISEYKFHPTRKWCADFANPEYKIIIEIEGGVFTQGRHTRGKGYLNDCEKYNQAQILGWTVLRYTYGQEGKMLYDVKTILKRRGLL